MTYMYCFLSHVVWPFAHIYFSFYFQGPFPEQWPPYGEASLRISIFTSVDFPPDRPSSPEEFLQENDLPEVKMSAVIVTTVPTLIVLPAIKLLLWGAHSPMPSPSYLCAVTLHYNLPILLIACKVYSGGFIQCVHEALTTLSPPLKSTISVVQLLCIVWLETSTYWQLCFQQRAGLL